MTQDIHYLGHFTSLQSVWEEYPSGGNDGDYVYINGVRLDWNKYERQWIAVVREARLYTLTFDVGTYNFAKDWRSNLTNGYYIVVNGAIVIGELIKTETDFLLSGFLTLSEAADGGTYAPVNYGDAPKTQSVVMASKNAYHEYVYVNTIGTYMVSNRNEASQIAKLQLQIISHTQQINTIKTQIEEHTQQIDTINLQIISHTQQINTINTQIANLTPNNYNQALIGKLSTASTSDEIKTALTPIGEDSPAFPLVGDILLSTRDGKAIRIPIIENGTGFFSYQNGQQITRISIEGSLDSELSVHEIINIVIPEKETLNIDEAESLSAQSKESDIKKFLKCKDDESIRVRLEELLSKNIILSNDKSNITANMSYLQGGGGNANIWYTIGYIYDNQLRQILISTEDTLSWYIQRDDCPIGEYPTIKMETVII